MRDSEPDLFVAFLTQDAHKIKKCQSVLCPALGSLQEEANTRIVLHCVVAAKKAVAVDAHAERQT